MSIKLTLNETIKALECCSVSGCCEYCNLKSDKRNCVRILSENAYNFLKGYRIKNKKLKLHINHSKSAKKVREKTIKAFKDKLNIIIENQYKRFSLGKADEFKIICQLLQGIHNDIQYVSNEMLNEEN